MTALHEAARALLEALDDPRMPSLYEHKRNLRAALAADKRRVSVPREPSKAMIAAMCQAHTECNWPDDFGSGAIQVRTLHARRAWDAALAAAEKEKG